METLIKILKSRTVWTIVLMFIIGGVNAISSFMPDSVQTFVLGVLGFLAAYFKINPSQDY